MPITQLKHAFLGLLVHPTTTWKHLIMEVKMRNQTLGLSECSYPNFLVLLSICSYPIFLLQLSVCSYSIFLLLLSICSYPIFLLMLSVCSNHIFLLLLSVRSNPIEIEKWGSSICSTIIEKLGMRVSS